MRRTYVRRSSEMMAATQQLVSFYDAITVGRLWLGESLRRLQWLGLMLGLAGVTTVLLSGNQPNTFELSWSAVLAAVVSLTWLVVGISISAILLLMYMIREGETSRVVSYFYLPPRSPQSAP